MRLLKLFHEFRASSRLGSRMWGRLVSAAGCGTAGLRVSACGHRLQVPEVNVELDPSEARIVLPTLSALRRIARVEPVAMARSEVGELLAVIGGVRFVVRTTGDLLVLEEIFGRQLYHLEIPGPAVVWDVGMNVGAASLWLARKPFVQAVVGYELFAPTCQQARENFRLNPALEAKIEVVNAGVGPSAGERELPYAEELKGIVGVDGPLFQFPGVSTRTERVTLHAADEVLRGIRVRHPGCAVIAKVDCEGAEYDILAALEQGGLLAGVSAWMIEWHFKGPEVLQAMLGKAGFRSVALRFEDPRFGMLYGFR